MARPSKLTEVQWQTITKRILAGEAAAALSREFGISKAAISQRVSKRVFDVKDAANQLVAADVAMSKLNVSEQIAARSLADDLKAISMHLAGAARFGASTAHRLAGIANAKAQEVDDAAPLNDESRNALKDLAVLGRMANEASEIPLKLLAANKEIVADLNKPDEKEDMHWTLNVVAADAG